MRVLILSLWYYPEPVAKPHDLATELAKRGHTVNVITGFPNYPQGRLYDGYASAWRQREWIDGVKVLRVRTVIDRSRSGFRRLLSYGSFSLMAVAAGALQSAKPDVIWTYQIGLPGVLLGRLLGVPLVHEVQDLWPEWSASGNTSVKGNSWLYRVLDDQERMIYRRAAAVTTISNGFRRTLVTKGVPADKIRVIPNWANEQNFRQVPRDEMLAYREGLAERFNIIYGGNIGTAQGLDVVLEAAEQLRCLPDVQFVLIGDGVERSRLMREAEARGLENLRFLGSRPPEQMAAYLALGDALLIHLLPNPMYEITIPSKTYAYLATGRPIIAAATGDTAQLVSHLAAGLACSPGDAGALAETVREMRQLSPSRRMEMGQAGHQAFVARFNRQVLVDQYEVAFTAAVERV